MSALPRFKSFDYATTVRWTGDRTGILSSEGKTDVRVASPPEFKGVPGLWTPEDLFVAAIDLCQMVTFIALALSKGIVLKGYEGAAQGTIEFSDGGYRFTRVLLSPAIVVAPGTDIALVEAVVHDAHQKCLIGRSITSAVEVTPVITAE
jgi:organic hydroperoxide reductase OsmC/OhrA